MWHLHFLFSCHTHVRSLSFDHPFVDLQNVQYESDWSYRVNHWFTYSYNSLPANSTAESCCTRLIRYIVLKASVHKYLVGFPFYYLNLNFIPWNSLKIDEGSTRAAQHESLLTRKTNWPLMKYWSEPNKILALIYGISEKLLIIACCNTNLSFDSQGHFRSRTLKSNYK